MIGKEQGKIFRNAELKTDVEAQGGAEVVGEIAEGRSNPSEERGSGAKAPG